jgi:hypothetical protein
MKGDNSDRVVVARVSVTWLSSNRASCYSKGMKLLTCIRYLLSGLALLGLVGAPLARPAMAMNMPAAMHAAMSDDAAMPADAAMAMPADMPCCPDKAPVPDCAKDCPLMALCLAGTVLSLSSGAGLLVLVRLSSLVLPGNDADLAGLGYGPPPRPPKT